MGVKDDSRETTDGLEADKRRIVELKAKLAKATLEMDKAKAELVLTLITAELEKIMTQPLP